MNYNDEFESLIKNFKLDVLEDDQEMQETPASVARKAAPASAPPREQSRAVTPPRPAPPRAPAPPSYETAQRPVQAKKGERKDAFRVNIAEEKMDPSTPSSARVARGIGGGGSGKPPRGGKKPRPQEDEDDEPESMLSGVNRWVKALVVLAAALGVSVFLAVFALSSASDLFGLNKEDMPIEVELQGELNTIQIADMLKESGVINQPFTFQIYTGFKYDSEKFVPGTYELNSNMSYDQIAYKFLKGNRQVEEVKILFYEGWTLREAAEALEKEGVCKAQDLYDYLDRSEFDWDFEFLNQMPEDKNRYRRFEGYLFPDTYDFLVGEDVRQVVLKFFRNFDNKMSAEVMQKIEASGMTIDEVITLASIVQHEAATKEDMKMVASVFFNRLKNPSLFPRLQSDVTIFYVRDNIKPFMNPNEVKLGDKDPNMSMYDSYDTYVRKGLPIGPICNPGMDAINAVLEPAQTDYYYFIADKDGVCHYAKTLEEHQKNINDAGLNDGDGEAHGTGTASAEAAQ